MTVKQGLAWSLAFAVFFVRFLTPSTIAQENVKPFATVSIAPLEKSLPDIAYLLSAFNMPEMTGMVELMTGFYTKGIDRTRPIGVVMSVDPGDDSEPDFLVCIPMTDHEQWFQAISGMGLEAEDLGDGMYEIAAAGQYLFAKSKDGWLFMGQSEDSLGNVPEDPVALLGDLPQRYNFALRLDLEQISPEARRLAIEQMRSQVEQNVSQQFGDQLGSELDVAREAGEAQLEQMEELMKDVQQIVLGFLTDPGQKRIYLDAAVQFLPGTTLAAQMDAQSGLRSEFAELQLPNSAFHARVTSIMSDDQEKATAKQGLREMFEQIEQALQRSEMPDDRSVLVKQLLDGSSKVLEQTIEEGIVDGAASLSMQEDVLRVLAGFRVADGSAIEEQIKEFVVGLSKASEIQFEPDFATQGPWRLHRLSAKLPNTDESISALLGEQIEIFIAASDKLLLVSLDPEGENAIRTGISQMEAKKSKEVTPMEVTMQIGSLMNLLQKANPDPSMEEMLEAFEQVESGDQVKVTTTALPRGMVIRATIEEGVLKTLGKMARSSNMIPGF